MENIFINEEQSVSISTDKDEQMISEPCRKHECKSHVFPMEFLEKLQINTDVLCPQCGSEFAHESALNLHIEKVHYLRVQKNFDEYTKTKSLSKLDKEREQCKCQYFCSVEGCKFNVNSGKNRCLPTFHSLKNHFVRIHGEKRFTCSKFQCGKQFSIKSEMVRHEINLFNFCTSSCGINYYCSMCNRKYAAIQSLKNHEKKKHKSKESNSSQVGDVKLDDLDQVSYYQMDKNLSSTLYVIDTFIDNIDLNIPFDLILTDYEVFSNY